MCVGEGGGGLRSLGEGEGGKHKRKKWLSQSGK